MSRNLLPFSGRYHPLTGDPIYAIGFRKNGRPIFPIMGGDPSNDPPERPEDVPQETWDALGDPGKVALSRERENTARAHEQVKALRAEMAKAARPGPPAPKDAPPSPVDQPDIAAIVRQAVDAAIKPFQDRETQRDAEQAAGRVRDAVLDAAKPLLHDPTDALAKVNLASVVDEQGRADADKVKAALERVVSDSPHLAKSTSRVAPIGIGGGGPAATPDADKVKSILAEMQRSTGIRTPAPN